MPCSRIKEIPREGKEIIFLISWNLIFNKATLHFYLKQIPFFIRGINTNLVGTAQIIYLFYRFSVRKMALSLLLLTALVYHMTKSANPERLLH